VSLLRRRLESGCAAASRLLHRGVALAASRREAASLAALSLNKRL